MAVTNPLYYYMYGLGDGGGSSGSSGNGSNGSGRNPWDMYYYYIYGHFPDEGGDNGNDGGDNGESGGSSNDGGGDNGGGSAAEQPVGLVMVSAPSKTAYKAGETLSIRGMVMQLVYPSGARETTTNYDYYPKTPLTTDNTVMEVRCEGFTVRQRITVEAKADCNCSGGGECTSDFVHNHTDECDHPEDSKDIRYISVSKAPEKKVYAEGEIFDPAGMEITGTTASGEKVSITSYSIATRGPLSSDNKRIVIKYKNLSAEYCVSIVSEICTNATPVTEAVALAKNADGKIYLGSGAFSAEFADVDVSDGNLSADVSHVYRSSGSETCCGENWRLNLHCSLKRLDKYNDKNTYTRHISRDEISKTSGEIDYIYTDGAGNRHAFDEVFCYEDENGHKQSIEGYGVKVDSDGRLYCVINNKRRTVTRELKTASGLRLSIKLNGVSGADKIEQRHEEIAKLENEIRQYKDAIDELEFNVELNGMYCAFAPAPSTELYNNTPDDATGIFVDFVRNAKPLELQSIRIQQMLNKLSVSENAPPLNYNNAQYIWALRQYDIELNKYFMEAQVLQNNRKKALISQYDLQISEYERMLEQKKRLLVKYKLQAPVAYLTDDEGTSMCFNEYGNLCGIVDDYDNAISVIWDEIYIDGNDKPVTEITSVRCGEHATALAYDSAGRLISVTDGNGKRVKYDYDGRRLKSATYSSGNALKFEYNCNGLLSGVTSESTAEKAELTYSGGKITGITRKTSVATLTDGTSGSDDFSYSVSETRAEYSDGKTKITRDGETKTYYTDYYGNVSASAVMRGTEYVQRPAFAYGTESGEWGYTVAETGDSVWTLSALTEASSEQPVAVISASALPKGETEYVFSAEANVRNDAQMSGYGMPFATRFGEYNASADGKRFCLTAKVIGGKTAGTYRASFDYRNRRAQYVSLPVTVDETANDVSIELYAECADAQNVAFDNFRFAPAEWTCDEADSFGRTVRKTVSEKRIAPGVYRSAQTCCEYDENDRCVKERTAIITRGKVNGTKYAVKKYSYCEHGNLVKTESYFEDEENEKGVNITEHVCDDKGNIVKEFSYNSLDSSTKFYKENEVSENGVTKAELDETGENKTEIEYIDGTTIVKSRNLSNGSKFAYGYDADGNVTAITQSTADGESNSTEINYTLGRPTKLTSGNNTVLYEYDKKRRITKVTVNGIETSYEYAGSKYDDIANVKTEEHVIGDITFMSIKADKVAATFENTTIETFTDKNGNIVMTKLDGNITTACNYNTDGQITASGDGITGSLKKYAYSADGLKSLNSINITAGENVESLTESYFRNDYGKVCGRVLGGAVDQSYAYFYKDNAARELEHISLPNELNYYPLTDVNGRNTGKEIKNANNENVYAEYIYYRKVGDHGTTMPSSVYFGKTKNNRYGISDNIKYRYDEMGNISEVRENGVLTVKYAYDKIGRLIREDNRKLEKSVFISYDNCGNILSKREARFTLKPADETEAFTDEKLYAYSGDKLLSFGDEILFYTDTEGKDHVNPTIYRGNNVAWNFGRQLASFGDNAFTYDGYGRRIKKNDIVFTYDANNKLVKQSDGENTLEFIYDNSGISGIKLVKRVGDNVEAFEYIYSKDVQGNIVGILDKSGKEVVQYNYDAWGNVKTEVIDEAHALIAELNPFRYRSYYYDGETHLYYLNTRYYDPETGRFISQDDVGYLDPEHINGLNLFAYCGNNPVMNVDPNGTFAITSFLIGLAIAAAIGAVVGAVSYTVSTAVTAVFTGEWNWSWGMFIGSIVGGAIGGALSFAIPGLGVVGSAAITGGLSTLIGMGLSNAMGESKYSLGEILVYTLLSAGISALTAGITQYIKLPGFTGRGSISQVARSTSTKFFNGTIKHISAKTFGKMICYEMGYSVFSTLAAGIIGIFQSLLNTKEEPENLIITGV